MSVSKKKQFLWFAGILAQKLMTDWSLGQPRSLLDPAGSSISLPPAAVASASRFQVFNTG